MQCIFYLIQSFLIYPIQSSFLCSAKFQNTRVSISLSNFDWQLPDIFVAFLCPVFPVNGVLHFCSLFCGITSVVKFQNVRKISHYLIWWTIIRRFFIHFCPNFCVSSSETWVKDSLEIVFLLEKKTIFVLVRRIIMF